MASTPLEHASKTGSDQAYFVVLAASACHAFFWGHQTHRSLWAYARAKVSSFCSPENSQPVNYDDRIEIDHINGDRRNARAANLQALHGHCHDAKTREHGDYLPHGMRDQHQNTEERSARKRARSVLEQQEVERSASRL